VAGRFGDPSIAFLIDLRHRGAAILRRYVLIDAIGRVVGQARGEELFAVSLGGRGRVAGCGQGWGLGDEFF
jgi:hypothetical protein